MSKKIAKEELEKLILFISGRPKGVSIEELVHSQEVGNVPKRTLQYRLANLVKMGILKKEGAGRSSKYCLQEVVENKSVIRNFVIPLSREALEVQKLISVPMQLRRHVSYKREFIDDYKPNKTFYLSPSILEKLAKLGTSLEKGRPAGTYARTMYQRLLIDLSWNSSRLEGNTYSLLETERLLEMGEEAFGKDRMETQMILNHKAAIEFMIDLGEDVNIHRYTILNIHGLLSHDLLLDPKTCGRLRVIPVKIGQSVYHPIEVPQLIEEYFQLILQKATAIKNPFEQSFFLMIHLPYLQPFLDVNKRVSRLAGNIPFIRENLSPLSFIDVPASDYIQGLLAIYEFNRIELFRDIFVWAYERSASRYIATLEALGEPDPFRIRYREAIGQVVREVVEQKINKKQAPQVIQQFAKKNIPFQDQNRFIEIVEIEVSSLHEGNFARFRIRPSAFFNWQKYWLS
ncbi:MAG: Fic family protein [Chlamydiae bacterium]|nr:Fic family protein [Chlamydiota bacterium]